MPKRRSWTDNQLAIAVETAKSYRGVLIALHLVPAGGNYVQVQNRVKFLGLPTDHFTGKRWNTGLRYSTRLKPSVETLLVEGSSTQSYKLKMRLFQEGIKQPRCELCGWAEVSVDGRIPVELDHKNGIHSDNRIVNLRILCPNCHSLQVTHRGKNKKVRLKLQ